MRSDVAWSDSFGLDVRFGYLEQNVPAPRQFHPQMVLNGPRSSVLRTLREELKRCDEFTFSVAFVSTRAIALLKQEFVEFSGTGRIITSNYLSFNAPAAFAELLNLRDLGIDVRIHSAAGFHPKGYIFERAGSLTAMIGSANLTANALVQNHEWNLRVSAAAGSDLAEQLSRLADEQVTDSIPLTPEWIANYADTYVAPTAPPRSLPIPATEPETVVTPNEMQKAALLALQQVRDAGKRRAIVISATGTGKTILSALDVRAASPRRMLFVVHREQILDRTMIEYRKVLGGEARDYGKLSGSSKEYDARYTFATVQTLSQPDILQRFAPDRFDYVIVDEAHRTGAVTYQRVLEHFQPAFLLGMTATPERTDGFNVFELFDYNVPYEIRLNHALEEDMLSPFHYYGVADVTFEDGRTTSDETELRLLISAERVAHLIQALQTYGQAGVAPRGLIFCGRKDEARALSVALNGRTLRGKTLRTVALTGDDSIEHREAMVTKLERGELDYILTVDVFNEGVDIPTVNQVVMLRQTKSAIVFVQQLGRGLRKADGKEYLVVIDFIGNYSNNYLIPIALFGDESLNRESLRQNLIAAEESGVLPGLSSVRFDQISQERVLGAIVATKLDSMQNLKMAVETLRNRLGTAPQLWDFLRFESVDPVLLATKHEHYPALLKKILKVDSGLNDSESRALGLLSHEVLPAKRLHEFVLLQELLNSERLTPEEIAGAFAADGLPSTPAHVQSALDTFTLENHGDVDRTRYHRGIVERREDGTAALTPGFLDAYRGTPTFRRAVDDLVATGNQMVRDDFAPALPFTPGRQYSRKEAMRLLNWPRKWAQTIYGYKVDRATSACPVFVTLHKSDEISQSTAYEDELLDARTMRWYTRSRRTLKSDEVRAIVDNDVAIHVFVKKDDAEGTDFYYLGRAASSDAEQTTMPHEGKRLDVVRMLLRFDEPITSALYDYFHPVVTL